MIPTLDDDDQDHGHHVRVNSEGTTGNGCFTDRVANTENAGVRLLLKSTITLLSFMGMMFEIHSIPGSNKQKLIQVYSSLVLILILAAFGWTLFISYVINLRTVISLKDIWTLQATAHFVIFYAVSLNSKGLSRCLEMWQAYRVKYGVEPGSINFKSNICTSVMVIIWCLCISLIVYQSVTSFNPNDNYSMISSIMNVIASVYLMFAWLASTGFMLVIVNLLADEYHLIYKQIQETSEGNPRVLNQRIGDIRRRYWELSKIVGKADDIFCAHMGVGVLMSLGLSCVGLYMIIWDESMQGDLTNEVFRTARVLTALIKLTSDCVAGVIMHDAVSITITNGLSPNRSCSLLKRFRSNAIPGMDKRKTFANTLFLISKFLPCNVLELAATSFHTCLSGALFIRRRGRYSSG